MISASHVYADHPALGVLRDFSLDLCPGEILGLWGAIGSGKRLALQVMAGRLDPREGRVWLGDRPMASHDPARLVRSLGLLERPMDLDDADNPMELGLTPLVLLEDPDPDLCLNALDLVELRDDVFTPLSDLNPGARRRAHLASLLVQTWNQAEDHPRFLFLDRILDGLVSDEAVILHRCLETISELGWGLLVTSRRPLPGFTGRQLPLSVGRVVDPAALGI